MIRERIGSLPKSVENVASGEPPRGTTSRGAGQRGAGTDKPLRPISESYPHIYLAEMPNGNECILKTRKFKTTFGRRILNVFYFKREVHFLKHLYEYDAKNFIVPKIINTDGKTFMYLEFLDGHFLKTCSGHYDPRTIARGVRELHLFRCERVISFPAIFIQRYITTVGLSIHRGAAQLAISKRNPMILINTLKIYYSCFIKSSKQSTYFFHHRDLINHDNSFVISDGRLGLIDFGNARAERRWILNDIIDLSIDYDININLDLLKECLREILPLCHKPIVIKDHVRVALMRRFLHPMRLTTHREFLFDVLLEDFKYHQWYSRNIEPGIASVSDQSCATPV